MDLVAVTAFGILYTIATLILLALGLAVIFGMMGVINLAQAEFLMVGAYRLSAYSVFVILMAFAVLGLTYGLFNYTRFGLVARATMQNPNMVSALGVNPARVYMGTFAFGAALAGLGGAVMAPLTGVVP